MCITNSDSPKKASRRALLTRKLSRLCAITRRLADRIEGTRGAILPRTNLYDTETDDGDGMIVKIVIKLVSIGIIIAVL